MLLLTGATGTIGAPLLRRLTASGHEVRCLVRDPRRLGAQRVRVQIAMGDLSDHLSFRHALRGVDTVVHLASVIRDQPGSSIEELAGVATWRLVRAAERAGVERFVFFSALGASTRSGSRLMRAKAVAERAVMESSLAPTVFAPSLVYAPNDPYLRLLRRMSLLPVMLVPGSGRTALPADLGRRRGRMRDAALPGGERAEDAVGARYELAGPETLTHRGAGRDRPVVLHRRRPVVRVPMRVVRRHAQRRRVADGADRVRHLG